jgi:glycerol kinase
MTCLLAIDQSTSATKALLFDAQGGLLDKAARPHRQSYPRPGWVEHDAAEIWDNTRIVLRELLERHRDKAGRLAGLSLTNQRETVVIFDCVTGEPLHPAIVWQCRRGDPICLELAKAGYGERITQITGLRLDSYFSASKLTWLQRERPDLAARLASGTALIGTVDTYLIHRLTGGRVFATDPTNACRTLLFDIARLGWDPGLCKLFGVPRHALAEVRESTATFGHTTLDGLLSSPIPICGVLGDSQASLFAQRCYQPGMAKVTFGTGSSVLLNVGSRLPRPQSGSVSTLAWVINGRPTYALEGLINCSAATIAWLKDQLGLIQNAQEAERLAASVPDNGGVYLVPAFAGLSAPHWAPNARGALVGLTAHSTRPHVARAAEESIAYQIRDVLEMMKSDAGLPPRRLHADGGPTADRFLMQFTADLLGLDLEVADSPDGSPLGATLAGMVGLGLVASLDQLTQLPRAARRYRAVAPPDVVDRLYAGWQEAVKRVL